MTQQEELLHLYTDNAPYMTDYQLSIVSAEPGRVRLSAPVRKEICNNFGIVHGGVLMSIADTAAGLAVFTREQSYVTQNSSFQFLRSARKGKIFAESTVLHRGKTIAAVRVELTDEDGCLLAEGLFSMFAVNTPFEPISPDR